MTTTAYTADQIEAEKPDWLWPIQQPGAHGGNLEGRIARKTQHFFAGHRDKGKGLSAVRLGADCAKAGLNVLHMAFEDEPALITRPRYEAAGVRGDVLKRVHLRRFRMPERQAEMEAYVEQHKIDLIIIDPVSSSLSGNIKRHSDNIREVLDPLQAFIGTTPTHPAVVWVEHVNKGIKKNSDVLSAIGGTSSGLVAYCRAGYIVGIDPDTDGDRILANVKHNFFEARPAMRFELDLSGVTIRTLDPETGDIEEESLDFPALLYSEECIFDPIRLLVDDGNGSKIGRPDDKKAAACEWLTNYLFNAHAHGLPKLADLAAVNPGEGVPSARVFEDAKLAGMTERTLRRAKQEMGVEVLPKGGRNAKWHLPQEIIDLLAGGDEQPAEAAPEAAEQPEAVQLVHEPTLDPEDPSFNAELAAMLAEYEQDGNPDNGDDEDGEDDE